MPTCTVDNSADKRSAVETLGEFLATNSQKLFQRFDFMHSN